MTRPDLKSGASPRVSVRQRRQDVNVLRSDEKSKNLKNCAPDGGRPALTTGAREASGVERAERIAAQGGLAALLYDALATGQKEAREERDAQDAASPASPELLAAIERSLLREKARRA